MNLKGTDLCQTENPSKQKTMQHRHARIHNACVGSTFFNKELRYLAMYPSVEADYVNMVNEITDCRNQLHTIDVILIRRDTGLIISHPR